MQDSLSVFITPVDSVRVAAQDITSEKVTGLMNLKESLIALWNVVIPEYIVLVLILYYIFVTRVPWIKTNTPGRRNFLMFCVAMLWGYVELEFRSHPWFSVIVTMLTINFAYEFLFKWAFKALEKIGWTPVPNWHLEEIKEEKQKEINQAEQAKLRNENR